MKQHISKSGLIGTILFHGILFAIFLSYGLSVPLPLPAEEGILINYGLDANGMGDIEPMDAQIDNKVASPQVNNNASEEDNLTQNYEDAPAINAQKNKKKELTNVDANTQNNNTKTNVTETPTEVPKQVNKKALYPGKNTGTATGSEGVNGGSGNQGSPLGSVNSKNHAPGNSRGNGTTSYSLSGRNPVILPKPEYKRQIEGKVVVEITVDKQGNVTKAVAGARGSTTLDENLLDAAEKAAYKAHFDVNTTAPALQKGTITYHFMLQ